MKESEALLWKRSVKVMESRVVSLFLHTTQNALLCVSKFLLPHIGDDVYVCVHVLVCLIYESLGLLVCLCMCLCVFLSVSVCPVTVFPFLPRHTQCIALLTTDRQVEPELGEDFRIELSWVMQCDWRIVRLRAFRPESICENQKIKFSNICIWPGPKQYFSKYFQTLSAVR